MPAKSQSQRRFFAGCEHNPNNMKNCPKGMSKEQMHDYASTKEKGLPMKKEMGNGMGMGNSKGMMMKGKDMSGGMAAKKGGFKGMMMEAARMKMKKRKM